MRELPVHVTGRAIALFEDTDFSDRAIARHLDIHHKTVARWRRDYRTAGSIRIDPIGRVGRPPTLRKDHEDVRTYVVQLH